MSWDDESASNPIADLRAWQQLVAAGAGVYEQKIHMSTQMFEMYQWLQKRDEILNDLLKRTRRRNFVRRYVLRRLKGDARLLILCPSAYRARYRLHLRWQRWKHRNDPYWDC